MAMMTRMSLMTVISVKSTLIVISVMYLISVLHPESDPAGSEIICKLGSGPIPDPDSNPDPS